MSKKLLVKNDGCMQLYVVLGVDVACEQCQLTMRKIPDTSYHYSDHEGVAALFTVRRNVTGMPVIRHFFFNLILCSLCENVLCHK